MAFAAHTGHPPTLHVTMAWPYSEGFKPASWVQHQGRVLDSLGKWLRWHDQPVAFAWVREYGPLYREHTHLGLHLAPELRDELHRHLTRAGRFKPKEGDRNVPIVIKPHLKARAGMDSPNQWGGMLCYWSKTLSPLARFDGDLVMPALSVDDRGKRPCTILGKRSGLSHSIGRAARAAAGWRELVTLDELRAVLHPTEGRRHDA